MVSPFIFQTLEIWLPDIQGMSLIPALGGAPAPVYLGLLGRFSHAGRLHYHLPVTTEVIVETSKGILSNLPHLKSVEIPIHLLVGSGESRSRLKDVLPPGVETVHIRPNLQYLGKFKEYSDAVTKGID
ncbi:hypothetical protein N7541_004850 [Penicillium brevicompactum]|uniref:Uncharacterized protein n=1 Tax=Penicillium brevicompactum TaxID=5074 RepID=A0A9W9RCU3_PENBR|nr:hypothetical protein N7541_004850 [Penicillium brevicompactum]